VLSVLVADAGVVGRTVAALLGTRLHRLGPGRPAAATAGTTRETAATATKPAATASTLGAACAAPGLGAGGTTLTATTGGFRTRRSGITFAGKDAEISCGATHDGHHDRDHDKFTHTLNLSQSFPIDRNPQSAIRNPQSNY
jgi:hypothetical protein